MTENVTKNGISPTSPSPTAPEERLLSNVTDESDDDDDDDISNYIPTPPDGGWGWVIVFASLMCNVIVDGIGYSFGIFLSEFVEFFDESRSKVSLIGSLLCGVYLCAGPLVSALTNKFGCRPVAFTGSIISTVAFVLATFSPNINILIITYGVLGGFGFGMIYLPSIVSVGYYFEKKRALATGIAVCGSGIGTFIFSPLTKYLLDSYDWKNALFILAGIVFNGCVCAMLMRPLEPKKKVKKDHIPREKTMIDRIREQRFGRKRNVTESSGIGPTDTTDILEKVRLAKLKREKHIQDNESEMCSLPSVYFEKENKNVLRADSINSRRSKLPKLSFSDKGDIHSSNPGTPMETPKIVLPDGHHDNADGHESVEGGSYVSTPPTGSPSEEKKNPVFRKRTSASESSHQAGEKITFANGLEAYEVQPLIKLGNPEVAQHRGKGTKALLARSGVDSGSRPNFGSTRSVTSKDYARPMYKKDIFYSGSVANISEFRSQPSMTSYITSITAIPGELEGDVPDGRLARMCPCLPKPVVDVLSEMLDVSLLTNSGFMFICLGNVLAMMGFYVPYVYIVDRALIAGIDKTQAVFLLSVIGITNTIGRVLSGLLADFKFINSLLLNNVCMLIAGIAILLTPLCNSYATLILVSSVFGLFTAAYISLTSVIICDLLGLEKLTNAFGLLTLARGISSTLGPPIAAAFISLTSVVLCDLLGLSKLTNAFGLLSMGRGLAGIIGPPLAGAVFTATGNYDASFFLGGCLFLGGTMFHFVLFLPCYRHTITKMDPGGVTVKRDYELEPVAE